MERAAHGDEEAFRLLVERWERPVFRFLARMLSSREEAEDASQETFLRVFEQSKRYQRRGQFRSWLFRIAGNLARSRLRRRRVLQWVRLEPVLHDRPDPRDGAEEGLEKEEVRRAIREALGSLPRRQREAVLLRRYEEMSYAEIASAMGVTVPAVESLLQRAMTSLRRSLAGKVVEP
jgi:RNA polymerase sigma-70 factor (ECF subfamily)